MDRREHFATPLDRAVDRTRWMIVAFGLFLLIEGVACAIESGEVREMVLRAIAASRGYRGCWCEDCRVSLLGGWDTSFGNTEDIARIISIPIAGPTDFVNSCIYARPSHGRTPDPWIIGRNLLLAAGPVLIFGLIGRATLRRFAIGIIPPSGECRACGYDLCGLPQAHVCPECGEPVREPRADRNV